MIWILDSLVEGVIILSAWDLFIFKMVNNLGEVNGLSLLGLISVGSNKGVVGILAEFLLGYVKVFFVWIFIIWFSILFVGFCSWTWEGIIIMFLQIICICSGILLWYNWNSTGYRKRLVALTIVFAFFVFNMIS